MKKTKFQGEVYKYEKLQKKTEKIFEQNEI